jgi:hypothetical protein
LNELYMTVEQFAELVGQQLDKPHKRIEARRPARVS